MGGGGGGGQKFRKKKVVLPQNFGGFFPPPTLEPETKNTKGGGRGQRGRVWGAHAGRGFKLLSHLSGGLLDYGKFRAIWDGKKKDFSRPFLVFSVCQPPGLGFKKGGGAAGAICRGAKFHAFLMGVDFSGVGLAFYPHFRREKNPFTIRPFGGFKPGFFTGGRFHPWVLGVFGETGPGAYFGLNSGASGWWACYWGIRGRVGGGGPGPGFRWKGGFYRGGETMGGF